MAAQFPVSAYSTNTQDTGNDGPDNDTLGQAADYNKHDEEIDALTQEGRKSYLKAFRNDTGGTLTKGTLVRITGFDAISGLPTVTKANAAVVGSAVPTMAEFVVIADVLNNANGNMAKEYTVSGIDTLIGSVGDRVYLSAAAGGFSFTALNPANENSKDRNVRQSVGVVLVDSSTGTIHFQIEDEDLLQDAHLEGWSDAAPSVAAPTSITITAQIIDKYGVAITGKFQVHLSLADQEFDDTQTTGVGITTGGGNTIISDKLLSVDKLIIILTSALGLVDITFDRAVADVAWARIVGPDGTVKTSKLTWT